MTESGLSGQPVRGSQTRTSDRYEVESHRSVAAVAPEWDQLATSVGAAPFLHPGWIEAWLRAFGGGRVEILALRRDGRLVAVLPLASTRLALRSPTNWHTPLFGPVSETPAATHELARRLLGGRRSWLDVSFLDADDPLVEGLRAAREHGWRVIERTVLRSPYLRLDGDWASFEAGLSSNFRGQLARRRRQLEREGELSFEWADGRDQLDRLLSEGLAVEGSGWKSERGTAILSEQRLEQFYRDVARWAAERGWLRLGFLRLDGRCIAFDLSFAVNRVVYWLKGGFDPAHHRSSPGMLLKREEIARAFGDGMLSYDFLGDVDAHKLRWTRTQRERVRVQAFPAAPTGYLGFVAWRYGRPAAKRVKERLARG